LDGQACTDDVCNGAGLCTHPAVANGTSCEDGDRCTTGDTCQSGTCRSGGAVACDPCLVCDAGSGGCVPPSGLGCAVSGSRRSSIVLRHNVSALADKVLWRWRGTGSLSKAALGLPASVTALTLCIYDEQRLALSATVPAGGMCSGRPCWLELPTGYRYTDPDGTPDGIQKLQMRAGPAGTGRIAVNGRGPLLAMPPLGLGAPVTVRLRRGDGAGCWESTYSVPTLSDAIQFKAKSD
jgi:hypothetical protein